MEVSRRRLGARPPVKVRYLDVALAPGQPQQRVRPEGGLDLGTTGRFAITYWAKA